MTKYVLFSKKPGEPASYQTFERKPSLPNKEHLCPDCAHLGLMEPCLKVADSRLTLASLSFIEEGYQLIGRTLVPSKDPNKDPRYRWCVKKFIVNSCQNYVPDYVIRAEQQLVRERKLAKRRV